MRRELLHTPEGVRDIYNEECEKKQMLQERLKHSMESYGYHGIQTPTFEFFDIFGREIGTTPSNDLYKFFDREGNTLVLRPDITPSVARAAAKYFMDEDMPIRLSYMGNTFINNSSYQGRLKETTQLGAELIGAPCVDADAEIISMAINCLAAAGLSKFQITIGHADFFAGLSEAAGLSEDAEEELRELIANKNFFGAEELVSEWNLDGPVEELFHMLNGFYDSADELKEVKRLAAFSPKMTAALERLEELHKVLEVYGIDKYVSYELGMASNYQYYTGIIFSGYTFGSGEPIVKGGRYDRLLSCFGKDAASIGFAVVVDQLMAALARQSIDIPGKRECTLIVYNKDQLKEAVSLACSMRREGKNAELIPKGRKTRKDYEAYGKRNRRDQIIFMDGEEA